MQPFVDMALSNVVLATVLAAGAAVVGRFVRHPPLIHALWILVLLKLLAPPFVSVPVDWLPAIPLSEDRPSRLAVFAQDRQADGNSASAPLTTDRPSVAPGGTATSPKSSASTDSPLSEFQRAIVLWLRHPGHWVWVGLTIWLAGSVSVLATKVGRIVRSYRTLARGRPAAEALQWQARDLSRTMGCRRCPSIWVVRAPIPPMLWGAGPWVRILFPQGLLDRLDRQSQTALLAHELGHYSRKDHWIRLLEMIAATVYWWCPLVWWARREIETAEEACCDAWVISLSSTAPRCYAEALLDAVDFLSDTSVALPSLASGIGYGRNLRGRLIGIMQASPPRKLSRRGRLAVLFLAAVLLPLEPQAERPASQAKAAVVSNSPRHAVHQAHQDRSPSGIAVPADRELTVPPSRLNPPRGRLIDRHSRLGTGNAWATAFAPDGDRAIVAGTDGRIRLKRSGGEQLVDLTSHGITAVAFSPDGRSFASGNRDGTVRLWNAGNGRPLALLGRHSGAVRSVDYARQGDRVVSSSDDGTIQLWHTAAPGKPVWLAQLPSRVTCVRFSPDGTTLAVASGDWKSAGPGRVTLWDLKARSLQREFRTDSAVGAVAFRPDNATLLVGEWNGRVTSWDPDSGREKGTYFIRKDAVSAAAFSPQATDWTKLEMDPQTQPLVRERTTP